MQDRRKNMKEKIIKNNKKYSQYKLDTLYKKIYEDKNIEKLVNYIKAGNTI